LPNEGIYTVRIMDDYDNLVSQPAKLTILYRPSIVLQPLSQSVPEGGTVSFTVAAFGTVRSISGGARMDSLSRMRRLSIQPRTPRWSSAM